MVGWHHQLSGHEFEQTPRDDEGQGSLESSSPWGHSQPDMTWQLNNNNLKLRDTNIQKAKIMASGPITSWQIDGVKMETVADFILLGSKITADGDCSHEIKDTCSLEEKR